MTLTREKLEIENPSQELLLEIVKTMPVDVELAKISMHANGIENTVYGENPNDRYIPECMKGGIMPSSILRLRYGIGGESFVPMDAVFEQVYSDITLGHVIKGGKFYNISLDSQEARGFEEFRKSLLGELLEEGYQFHRGGLVLSTYRLSGYNEGEYDDAAVNFGYGFPREPRKVEFKQGRELPDEDVSKVTDWFKALKKKHS